MRHDGSESDHHEISKSCQVIRRSGRLNLGIHGNLSREPSQEPVNLPNLPGITILSCVLHLLSFNEREYLLNPSITCQSAQCKRLQ